MQLMQVMQVSPGTHPAYRLTPAPTPASSEWTLHPPSGCFRYWLIQRASEALGYACIIRKKAPNANSHRNHLLHTNLRQEYAAYRYASYAT